MKTKIINPHEINEVVSLLKQSEVVALPTETVYGLAADAKNESAIRKIFSVKGRPSNHPLILHINSFDQLTDWADNISMNAKKLAKHFWPGPLTMILHKKDVMSDIITGGLDTIAIRMPNHLVMLAVIEQLGNPIVAPSANAYQKISPTEVEHVLKTLGGKIPAIVDGGNCSIGIESTIINMTKEVPIVLRPGAITPQMIEDVLKIKIESPIDHSERVSGNMKNHYQPEKPLFIVSLDEIEDLSKNLSNIAIVHYSKILKSNQNIYYQMSEDKGQYAKKLYKTLHDIDKTAVNKIFIESPPQGIDWTDIHDRLLKASTK